MEFSCTKQSAAGTERPRTPSTRYRKTGDYDNSQAWAAVRVPVLILFGADDALVPPQESVAQAVRLLKGAGKATVVVHIFAHADHTLASMNAPLRRRRAAAAAGKPPVRR